MKIEVRKRVLATFILGTLLGAAGFAALNGDALTAAQGVKACIPPDAALCGAESCTAV